MKKSDINKIETIDLWTEQYPNHYECFNGAFIDGFENGDLPFDSYKIKKNCNCIISNNSEIPIGNKHHAVVFYKNLKPVRLMVICKDTNIDDLLNNALNQKIGNKMLHQIFTDKIRYTEINMQEKPIFNKYNFTKEIDAGSCDRFSLLKSMLSGSYTEDESNYGHYDSDRYFYVKNLNVTYYLKTDTEIFDIAHEGGFLNDLKTRIIILQKKFSGN